MQDRLHSSQAADGSDLHVVEAPPGTRRQSALRRIVTRTLRVVLYSALALGWGVVLAYLIAVGWTAHIFVQNNPHWDNDIPTALWHLLRPAFIANVIPSVGILLIFLLLYLILAALCIRVTLYVLSVPTKHDIGDAGKGPLLLGDSWYDPHMIPAQRNPGNPPDPLGYKVLAKSVADTIVRSANRAPFAIAIEGRWGIGKTTVMRMVERTLKDKTFTIQEPDADSSWKCVTIWFNPWRHRRWDAQKAFMNAVFSDIPWRSLRWWYGSVMRGRIRAQIANIASFLRGGMRTRISNELDVNAQYRDKFQTDFTRLLAYWSKGEGKARVMLVIFIDDLDRCAPSDIAPILEALKLFFESRQCVFVLGFDLDIVAASIARELHGQVPDGLAYLQKIVQVEFPLLQPSDDSLRALIRDFVESAKLENEFAVIQSDESDYAGSILRYTQRTPRQIKRLMNGMAMLTPLHAATEYYTLFWMLLLQVRWPLMFNRIVKEAQQGETFPLLERIRSAIDEFDISS